LRHHIKDFTEKFEECRYYSEYPVAILIFLLSHLPAISADGKIRTAKNVREFSSSRANLGLQTAQRKSHKQ